MLSSVLTGQTVYAERKIYSGAFDEHGLEGYTTQLIALPGVLFAPGSTGLNLEPDRAALRSEAALFWHYTADIQPEDVFIIGGERWAADGRVEVWPLGSSLNLKKVEG